MRLLATIVSEVGHHSRRCMVLLGAGLLLCCFLPGQAAPQRVGYASGAGQAGHSFHAGGQPIKPAHTPVFTTAPQPTTSGGNESPLCYLGPAVDLCATFGAVLQAMFIAPVNAAVTQFIQTLIALVWSTPKELTYGNTALQGMWQITLLVADAFIMLAISIAGIRLLWERNVLSYVDLLETIPQVILAVFLAHLSRYLVAGLIGLNNALIQAFSASGELALTALYPGPKHPADPLAQVLLALLGVLISILIIEQVIRLIVVNLGFVLAAAGCFCLAYKPLQPLGRLWLSTFLAAVFAQVLQMIMLDIGLLLLTAITAKLSLFYVNVLLGIGTVYIALVVPTYLYRWAMQPVTAAARRVIGAGEAAVNAASTTTRAAGAVL